MQHSKSPQDVNIVSPLALAASANVQTGVLLLCKEALVTAIQDSRLQRTHLRVLACIADCINRQTGKAWPGRQTIAESLAVSVATVSNTLLELRNWGYLIAGRERVAEAQNRTLIVYTFGKVDHETIRREIQSYVDRIKGATSPQAVNTTSPQEVNFTSGGEVICSPQEVNSPRKSPQEVKKSSPQEVDSNSKKETHKEVSVYAPQAAPAKRGTRLPLDWVLPKAWGDWAVSEFGVDATQVRAEGDHFRDYWISKPGKDGSKLDWAATWRNWCRNAKWGRSRSHSNRMSLDLISDVVDDVFERSKPQKPQGNLRLTDER